MSSSYDASIRRCRSSRRTCACTWAGWRALPRPLHAALPPHAGGAGSDSARWPLERAARDPVASGSTRLVRARARATCPTTAIWPPPSRRAAIRARRSRATLARDPAAREARPTATSREAFLARDIPRARLIRGKTSGTTGTALPLWYTPEALAEEYATRLAHAPRAAASELARPEPHLQRPDRSCRSARRSRPSGARTTCEPPDALLALPHDAGEPARTTSTRSTRARALRRRAIRRRSTWSARAMLDAGRPLAAGPPRARCFTSSESLLAFQRETIEKAFGAPVRDRYGVSEFVRLDDRVRASGRLHVDMEFCIVEVEVAEETRRTGCAGRCSSPASRTTRRRCSATAIGDVGTRSKRPCPCGRAGDVFLDVDGRIEDYVMTPDGRLDRPPRPHLQGAARRGRGADRSRRRRTRSRCWSCRAAELRATSRARAAEGDPRAARRRDRDRARATSTRSRASPTGSSAR